MLFCRGAPKSDSILDKNDVEYNCLSRMKWFLLCVLFFASVSVLTIGWFAKSNDIGRVQTGTSGEEHLHKDLFFDLRYSGLLRGRRLKGKKETTISVTALGTSSFIYNRTIFGTLLSSGHGDKQLGHLRRLNHSTNSNDQQLANSQLSLRSLDMKGILTELPFPVVQWPHVATKSCPSHRYSQLASTGQKPPAIIALAHFQIWLDFVFFDHDVIQALKRNEVKKDELYASTYWSSVSGVFLASINGTLFKNGEAFYEDDIMVIFEDDAHIAVSNVNESLKVELSSMTTDLLYLGWREAEDPNNAPLSTYAYAITRRGARIAAKYFDPCRNALDVQFAIMTRHKWLTYRTAAPSNYNLTASLSDYNRTANLSNYDGIDNTTSTYADYFDDRSRGIFRQRRDTDKHHPFF